MLNGTAASGVAAVPGFATEIAKEVKQAGYKVGDVSNSDTSFVETEIMYVPGMKAAARQLAEDLDATLGRTSVRAIIPEVRELAGKADLAVVLGVDDAQAQQGGAPTTTTPPAETTTPPAETTTTPPATDPAVPTG